MGLPGDHLVLGCSAGAKEKAKQIEANEDAETRIVEVLARAAQEIRKQN